MDKIKYRIQILLEFIFNKRCKNCKYFNVIFCTRRDSKGDKCINGLFPIGFEKKY